MINGTRNTKQQHILDVAQAVFLEYGYDKSSIRLITERANINNAMLHYYFINKENLFNKFIIRQIETLNDIINKSLRGKNPLDKLLEIIENHINLIHKHQSFYKLMVMELLKNENNLVVNYVKSFFISNELQIFELLDGGLDIVAFKGIDKQIMASNIMGILINSLVINSSNAYPKKSKKELITYYRNYFVSSLALQNKI